MKKRTREGVQKSNKTKISKKVGSFKPKVFQSTGEEVKYNDTTLAATAITAAGIILHSTVNAPQQGTEVYQRVGRKISIRSIHMRGTINVPQQTDLALMCTNVRIIVYHDKQCNNATATVGNILQNADNNSFRNIDTTRRFKILYDKNYSFNKNIAVLAGPVYSSPESQYNFEDLNKKVNIPIHFQGNAGTVADIASDNIGILCIADVATNAFLDGYFRIRYTDA